MLNLNPIIIQSMVNLQTWRNRYTKEEYPEKIVKNIFYRKHIMESIFPFILNQFDKGSQCNSFEDNLNILQTKYSDESKTIALKLDDLIMTKGDLNTGDCSYNSFLNDVRLASNGSNSKIEELEYAYVYYHLADESILCWAAFGGIGYSQRDAIGKLTGRILLEDKPITLFWQIESVIGRLGESTLKSYRQLPPLF